MVTCKRYQVKFGDGNKITEIVKGSHIRLTSLKKMSNKEACQEKSSSLSIPHTRLIHLLSSSEDELRSGYNSMPHLISYNIKNFKTMSSLTLKPVYKVCFILEIQENLVNRCWLSIILSELNYVFLLRKLS